MRSRTFLSVQMTHRKLRATARPDRIGDMAFTSTAVQDRRRFGRVEVPPRLAVDLLQPDRRLSADAVNISEAGLCLRLEERLEVRSLVNLQLTPSRAGAARNLSHLSRLSRAHAREAHAREAPSRGARAIRCEGRVAWVIQRLDLRDEAPYLFDVGIEFADPPAFLRRLMIGRGSRPVSRLPAAHTVSVASAVIRGREYVPRLERRAGARPSWHLIISVDGVPCLSERYLSERAAKAAWEAFRRRQARRVSVAS